MSHNFILIVKNGLAAYLASYLFFISSAYAYVDPGSGSVIVTTVLGFIAAASYVFRQFFYKLKAKLFGSEKLDEDRSIDE
jgi:hypothetical protein